MSTETSYAALFALLSTLKTNGTVVTCSRRLKQIKDVDLTQMPALYMVVAKRSTQQRQLQPAKRTLGATVVLYLPLPSDTTAPGPAINDLIDAVEAVLAPSPANGVQDLGGTVSHCWIEGETEVFEGVLDDRSAVVIPIHILVP